MKVYGYARSWNGFPSHRREDLARQDRTIRAYAERRMMRDVTEVVTEEGSGLAPPGERLGLDTLLGLLEEGDVVIAETSDRIALHVPDFEWIRRRLRAARARLVIAREDEASD